MQKYSNLFKYKALLRLKLLKAIEITPPFSPRYAVFFVILHRFIHLPVVRSDRCDFDNT